MRAVSADRISPAIRFHGNPFFLSLDFEDEVTIAANVFSLHH
jgi:hypothetical protein